MFENQTESVIVKRMLERVPASRDKRQGNIIYDATMPAAIEFMLLYAQLDWYIKQSFADTADRPYLVRIALERGMAPYPASNAIVKGLFEPSGLEIAIGQRFTLDTLHYIVTEKLSDGIYLLQCETEGVIGNRADGKLIPVDYINGLQKANLVELIIPGEDEEATEDFRQRYLKSFNNNAFGGNIADYKEKVNKIQGVGGIKVYPIWQGGGTVRVVFMTSECKPPTVEFVDEVQTALDPIPNQGLGLGIAPIGHIVTVEGVRNSNINIQLNITYATGYSFADLKERIEEIIDDYFLELNKEWANTQIATTEVYKNTGLIVRISQIEARLLEIAEIEDIQHTKLNGEEENLLLDMDELAVRGQLNG